MALASASPALGQDSSEEEEEDNGLRQRLTEREDKRRPPDPWSIDVGGRPLFVSGEIDTSAAYVRRFFYEEDSRERDRFLIESTFDVEAFYTFGTALSLFAQVSLNWEEDVLGGAIEDVSDFYVERGEMWLYSEELFGLPLNFDIGRLDFEDERRWWWDTELDAARLEWEADDWDVTLAVGRELFSERSDRSFVDPENDRVLRILAEGSWDFAVEHGFEFFALHQRDHSKTERPGEIVSLEREDDSDANLTWLGARVLGVFDLGARGLLGYWADVGYVWGEEDFLEFDEISSSRSVLEEVLHRDVRGWGFDVGVQWLPNWAFEPRFFVAYAQGSGDGDPGDGTDRAYRQTQLNDNEAGFGGVERFNSYGVLLAPELSNLRILTLGAGISLLRSSSLDLVYHYYRQVDAAPFLRDARIEADLTGTSPDIGHEVDLVLALEEWERLEFEFIVSAFRPGAAFGRFEGKWSYGGFFAVRYGF